MNCFMKCILVSFFCFLKLCSFSQTPANAPIEISSIQDSVLIMRHCELYVDSSSTADIYSVDRLQRENVDAYNVKQFLPDSWLTSTLFLKFTVKNSSDSLVRFYFLAGNYVRKNEFYKTTGTRKFTTIE